MKKTIFWGVCICILSFLTALVIESDHKKKVAEQLDLFQSVFHLLDENYVDEIDPEKLIRVSIDAMLKSTDPYTAFYNETESRERNKSWKGILYAGIGASVVMRDSNMIISEPYAGYGAWQNDLRAGDQLMEVEGKSVKGKKLDEIIKLLRGEAETSVHIKIKRGDKGLFEKSIIRKEIHVKTVPYFGMIDSSVGYIKMDQFLENTSMDFKEAFQDLKKNHNCTSLVIDLRSNNGGLVDEAVKILGLFLPENTLICTLKGRQSAEAKQYKTHTQPLDTVMPLVILTSEKSISAAEIFAGCMQDLDRAVIMGQKTYGKGFVQGTRFPGYGSSLYVTAARYHTPSGRCVQQLDYSKLSEGKVFSYADSVKEKFFTKNHRPVYNKGGIEPDTILKNNLTDEVIQSLMQSYFIFDFANAYRNSHASIASVKTFQLDEKNYNLFIQSLEKKDYQFETRADKHLKELEKNLSIGESEKDFFKKDFKHFKSDLRSFKKKKILENSGKIKDLLAQEIIRRYNTAIGVYEYSLLKDQEIISAAKLLLQMNAYRKILHDDL